MLIPLGTDYFEARSGRKVDVNLDTSKLINAHMLLLGSSGVGKSHTLKKLIAGGIANSPNIRFHVPDVHGDLVIPGESVVQFSEQEMYGLNPLRVNPSREFGGVRKSIQAFIRTINQVISPGLGIKQESVLRNLLEDVYLDFGFDVNDASTWSLNALEPRLVSAGADNRLYLQVSLEDKDKVKAFGARWDGEQRRWWVHANKYTGDITKWKPAFKERTYPTIDDVAAYARRLYEERFIGSDQKAVTALTYLNKVARSLQRKTIDSVRLRSHHIPDSDGEAQLEQAGQKVIEAVTDYVKSVRTGYELENLMKYDSPDVLKSVLDRINNLRATGVFKGTPPPFDPSARIWRYKLNSLFNEEKKMLVLFLLQDLFYKAVQRGEQSEIVDIIVLDELGTYTSTQDESGDGIIGIIAREARKFGMGLWAANQSPENVPGSLISSVGTKIILGIDETHWNMAVSKMRIDQKLLNWIQPMQTMAVQLKEKKSAKSRWWWVQLPT